jgi:hypothetical protein
MVHLPVMAMSAELIVPVEQYRAMDYSTFTMERPAEFPNSQIPNTRLRKEEILFVLAVYGNTSLSNGSPCRRLDTMKVANSFPFERAPVTALNVIRGVQTCSTTVGLDVEDIRR